MPSSRGSSKSRDQTRVPVSPALADGFFTTSATWESRPRGISQMGSLPLVPPGKADPGVFPDRMSAQWRCVATGTLDDRALGVHAKPN